MNGFITILAASAVLSASLVAGFGATSTAFANGTVAETAPVTSAKTTWIEPPAKAVDACREAAWPYRPASCAATGAAPVRKVRVIGADGRSEPSLPTLVRLTNETRAASIPLPLR